MKSSQHRRAASSNSDQKNVNRLCLPLKLVWHLIRLRFKVLVPPELQHCSVNQISLLSRVALCSALAPARQAVPPGYGSVGRELDGRISPMAAMSLGRLLAVVSRLSPASRRPPLSQLLTWPAAECGECPSSHYSSLSLYRFPQMSYYCLKCFQLTLTQFVLCWRSIAISLNFRGSRLLEFLSKCDSNFRC